MSSAGKPKHRPARPAVFLHDMSEDLALYDTASFVQRWYALTIDLSLVTPLNVLVHLPFTRYLASLEAHGQAGQHALVAWLLVAVPFLLYFVAPTVLWGHSLGKRIVGIRVVPAIGDARLDLGQIIIRESVGKLLSLLLFGVGIVMLLLRPDRRSLHDWLAGTKVIAFRDMDR